MARKVTKRRPKKTRQVVLTAADLRFPGENRQYWMAVGILTWACLLIAIPGFYFTKMWQWVYLAAWPLGSLVLVNYLSDMPRRKQLKQLGPQARVRGNNHIEMYKVLSRLSAQLSFRKPPQMCVVEEDHPYLYSTASSGGTIIITRALINRLTPEELAVALGHELTHVKCRHMRLERALYYIRIVQPLLQFFFGPVAVWSLLMGEWLDLIDYTADRGSLLLVGNPTLVNATSLKLCALADPQSAITPQDIEDYLTQGRSTDLDPALMERQFKLNKFMESQPNLRDRVAAVAEFYQSEEGQVLLEKAAQIRSGVTNA